MAAPFAIRASRIPRLLLLHQKTSPSFRELSKTTQLAESVVSRTLNALADDGLVDIQVDRQDARRKRVQVTDPGALLTAFEQASVSRRTPRQTWEIGASNTPMALRRLRAAAKRLHLPYSVSGGAGASFIRRAVDPIAVDAWVERDTVELWQEELGAIASRPGPGKLTIYRAPEPFVLSLATRQRNLWIADPVQVYLDCRRAGERALEAAEAVRDEMGW